MKQQVIMDKAELAEAAHDWAIKQHPELADKEWGAWIKWENGFRGSNVDGLVLEFVNKKTDNAEKV